MNLSEILGKAGKHRNRKRVGRGRGSGNGKTCGRGHGGAGSRAGFTVRLSYEGGQVSLIRHLPKRGFSNFPFRKRYDVVNLVVLEKNFEDGADVSLDGLVTRGILNADHGRLKVLGSGSLSKKLQVTAHAVSTSARQKIEAAGGAVTILAKKKGSAGGKTKKTGGEEGAKET